MAKAVLISIRPEWVEKIARGEKTVEVRKTRPKLDTPFKCYIYCTQGNDARRLRGSWGKVIGEFICDRVETIKAATEPYGIYDVDDDFADFDMLCNFIVIEAMCLYLSGDLDRLEAAYELQGN